MSQVFQSWGTMSGIVLEVRMPAGQIGLLIMLWDKVRGLEVLRMVSSSFPSLERFAENPEQGFPSAPGNCQTEALGWGW